MSIRFFGDVYIDRKVNICLENGLPYVINLEYVYGSSFNNPAKGKVNLKSDFPLLECFGGAPPIAACVANNHMMDFGVEGLMATLNNLDLDNIMYFGAGNKEDNFNNPLKLKIDGKNIALLGYTALDNNPIIDGYGVAEYSKERYLNDIEICKKSKVDRIIVYIHFGIEEYPYFTRKQQELAHQLIDYGCDLVIGQHPHCIQPMEEYKGKCIFYSIGNAIFPDFCVDSFYNEKGNSTVKYSKRNLKWNNEGLVITYSIDENRVECINRTFFKKSKFFEEKKEYIFKDMKKVKFLFLMRKISSVITSMFFIGGYIINFSFIKNEFRLFCKKFNKGGDK